MDMSPAQLEHQQAASRDNTMRASYNHGRPPVAATQKAGVFYGQGVTGARTAGMSAPAHAAGTPEAGFRPSAAHAPTRAPAGASAGRPRPGPAAGASGGPLGNAGNARPQSHPSTGHANPARGGERQEPRHEGRGGRR
ncbi:MAG: hypothetical protein JO361_01780 [Gammaproteobacteria bacterium]|nr:hypothetical protein [Gammaproteobacteria bacterium]